MRINIYKYMIVVSKDCVNAQHVRTVEVETFPSDQTEFARDNGGDFIEIEEQDDLLHWAGTLQENRERHLRELLAEGLERT